MSGNLCDVLVSSTLSITITFFRGDGLRGDENMPVISSMPFASRGLGSNVTPVRLFQVSLVSWCSAHGVPPSQLANCGVVDIVAFAMNRRSRRHDGCKESRLPYTVYQIEAGEPRSSSEAACTELSLVRC